MNSLRFRFPVAIAILFTVAFMAGCARMPENPQLAGAGCGSRGVPQAPAEMLSMTNPLTATAETIEAGRRLYEETAEPVACAQCHGNNGSGNGPLARHLDPAPADFTCADYRSVPDGQLFWITRDGSSFVSSEPGHSNVKRPGRRDRSTAMRPHANFLSETEIWQILTYLRTLHSADD